MLNTININLKTDIKTDRPTSLPIKLMSQDKNNNQFILRFTNGGESVTLDDTYTVDVLTKFTKSGTSRLTTAKVRQDYATWEFDTEYITQDETVYNYVYVRKSGTLVISADSNAFYFAVGLSEVDKDAGRVAETYDENYQKVLDDFKEVADFTFIQQAEAGRESSETTRKTNETTRISNEDARKSAEVIRLASEVDRVSAEEQRKTDHANRSAELAGKADKVVLKNLVENGDFNTQGIWTESNSTIDYANNKLTVTGDGTLNYPQVYQNITRNSQHKYYLRTVLEKVDTTIIEFRISTTTFGASEIIKKVGTDTEYILSGVIENAGGILRIYGSYPTGTSGGKSYIISEVLEIDLTQTFGAGNEPTKEEMDELIKVTGYIDREYALNNKEMLNWQLKLMRQNRNALIALGGTII